MKLFSLGVDQFIFQEMFRVENNFPIIYNDGNGVAVIAIHNRSVDMLLKLINTKVKQPHFIKKLKLKHLIAL